MEKVKPKFYTGVGSRKTPAPVLGFMSRLAGQLEGLGYTLRSGGAKGADRAFESGVKHPSNKEIYYASSGNNQEALALAEEIHPAWHHCSYHAQMLHARNCFQVLGEHLKNPSEFLICWTEGGKKVGGTRTAIVLAERWGIPVFNLADKDSIRKLEEHLNETIGGW